jgi:hypothetical protein
MNRIKSQHSASNLKESESFLTFSQISGFSISREEVIEEIKSLPLDGILGFLGGISLEMIQYEKGYFSRELQGSYLKNALVDDFPREIPIVSKLYSPGYVPNIGKRYIFVHEQNMAWLCHLALLYAKQGLITPRVSHDLCCRLSRILLIINDFLSVDETSDSFDLNKRRIITHEWLRHGQFNRYFGNSTETLAKLARQKIILSDILPKYFEDVHSAFQKAMGISLQRFFEVLSLFISHFHKEMRPGNHWLAKDTLFSNVKANHKDIKIVLDHWLVSPEKYRTACDKWRNERKDMGELPIYDYVPLRKRPLIEARPGGLICAVPSFVFSKIEDEPFFILSDFLTGTELNKFHTALGYAYEEYANGLVERLANHDKHGKWFVKHSPENKQGEQLTDIYLQRGKTAVAFEHKAQRPSTEFLRGGEGDRVVGPSSELLSKLNDEGTVDLSEGKKHDEGFITYGMWQQSKTGNKLLSWAEKEFGEQPTCVFPVITLFSSLVVDTTIRKMYLDLLTQKAELYKDDFWESPQWLNVNDLEFMVAMAEKEGLDLESLLNEKSTKFEHRRFDSFLYEYSKQVPHIDNRLIDEVESLLNKAARLFFLKNHYLQISYGNTNNTFGKAFDRCT